MYLAPKTEQALAAMEGGRYLQAAALFEEGAIAAYQAGELTTMKMSTALSIKAYAMGGDGASVVRFASSAIDALAAAGRVPEISGFATKLLRDIRAQGQPAAADAFSAHVSSVVGAGFSDPDAPKLAPFCPSCGAAVKPADVVRPTPSTVACPFCGASLSR